MGIRLYKAYTPGTRNRSVSEFNEITRSKPEKSLTIGKHRSKGRNNRGIITSRHRGGGHKRLLRAIKFQRTKIDISAKVEPNKYVDNESDQPDIESEAESDNNDKSEVESNNDKSDVDSNNGKSDVGSDNDKSDANSIKEEIVHRSELGEDGPITCTDLQNAVKSKPILFDIGDDTDTNETSVTEKLNKSKCY
jgi:hypothetical protein